VRQEIYKQIPQIIQEENFEKYPCSLFKAAGAEVREETFPEYGKRWHKQHYKPKPCHPFICKTQTIDNVNRKKLK